MFLAEIEIEGGIPGVVLVATLQRGVQEGGHILGPQDNQGVLIHVLLHEINLQKRSGLLHQNETTNQLVLRGVPGKVPGKVRGALEPLNNGDCNVLCKQCYTYNNAAPSTHTHYAYTLCIELLSQ